MTAFMTPRCEFLMYLEDRNSKESIVDYHYKKMEEFKNDPLIRKALEIFKARLEAV